MAAGAEAPQPAPQGGDAPRAPSLSCVGLSDLAQLGTTMLERGCDFWLSSLADGAHRSLWETLNSMTCDGVPATDAFTHCFIVRSQDTKSETELLMAKFGLGLRQKEVHRSVGPGYMFMLVNLKSSSPLCRTVLSTKRKQPPDTDAEQRASKKAAQSPQDLVVTADPVVPCTEAVPAYTSDFPDSINCGKVQDAEPPGIDVQPKTANAADLRQRQFQALEKRIATLLPKFGRHQIPPEMVQKKLEDMLNKPAGRLSKFRDDIARIWQNFVEADLYRRQLRVLERRLEELLPGLPRQRLSTALVQSKLEESMQKPAGRLDRFQADIELIWRAFIKRQDLSSKTSIRPWGVSIPTCSRQGDDNGESEEEDDVELLSIVMPQRKFASGAASNSWLSRTLPRRPRRGLRPTRGFKSSGMLGPAAVEVIEDLLIIDDTPVSGGASPGNSPDSDPFAWVAEAEVEELVELDEWGFDVAQGLQDKAGTRELSTEGGDAATEPFVMIEDDD